VTAERSQAGFTLVELLIALSLFALIGVAGVALVESVIGVQERTRARLDRIAEIRRASFLVGFELDQIEAGDFQGSPAELRFRRHGFRGRETVSTVRYAIGGGALTRQVDEGPPRPLLIGVRQGQWRYFSADRGWISQWRTTAASGGALPGGVALDLTLGGDSAGASGAFRRVVVLPSAL
jgi:general secretion pathway protein J